MRILVVDDNRSSADALARHLNKRGEQAEATYDGATAIAKLQASPPDLVLTDLKMEPVGGIDVLRAARALRPPVEVVVFTAYGDIETAVGAIQMGAHDFLTKPVTIEQVLSRVEDVRSQNGAPAAPIPAAASNVASATEDVPDDFVALSDSSKSLRDTLARVAPVASPIWLEGEIGSGRGHAAWLLHRLGRPDTPLTVVDPGRDAAWPAEGTAVLPNVDELPDDLQRDLVRRLGHLPSGLRIVATASPNAREKLADGQLNEELYYRLAVIVIPVPPLRQRTQDILPLFKRSLATLATRYGRAVPALADEQLQQLVRHSWPGNIRELRNLAERVVVLGETSIDLRVHPVASLSDTMPDLDNGFSLSNYLESVERKILVAALRKTDNDRTAAGKLLGVERNTLRYKLNKYGLLDR